MMPDHYATLGTSPDASAAAIRAAYLALMREYHPDRNPDPAATLRAQAVIEAFKVLGDFDRRNHYDWDRRREREAGEAAAARRPGRLRRGAIGAGAVGLAAVGAWLLMSNPAVRPARTGQEITERPKLRVAQTDREAPRAVKVAAANRQAIEKVEPPTPADPVSKAEPARTPVPAKPDVAPRPKERMAAVTALPRRIVPETALPSPARSTRAALTPVRPPAKPAPAVRSDLASLDQFVMGFYGQSWRYGDAPKRAALEQSRASFIARRSGCTGDSCTRDAYLRLMSDVSAIVESRRTETP